MGHDMGVTRNYLPVKNTLEDGFWDDCFREVSYYEGMEHPLDSREQGGREVGEFDVLAVNYDEEVFLYIEVKTGYGDLKYAREQLERADEFFDDWDRVGQTYLEN